MIVKSRILPKLNKRTYLNPQVATWKGSILISNTPNNLVSARPLSFKHAVYFIFANLKWRWVREHYEFLTCVGGVRGSLQFLKNKLQVPVDKGIQMPLKRTAIKLPKFSSISRLSQKVDIVNALVVSWFFYQMMLTPQNLILKSLHQWHKA